MTTLWPENPRVLLKAPSLMRVPSSLDLSLDSNAGVNLWTQFALLGAVAALFAYFSNGKVSKNLQWISTGLIVISAASTIYRQSILLGAKPSSKSHHKAGSFVDNEEENAEPSFLTPAQSTLHASEDNPYGNYRPYDVPPTKVYTGPIAMPPDDTLARMAYGTEIQNPGHIYYTRPDPTQIEQMRSRHNPSYYGVLGQGEPGYAKGGAWYGR